MSQFRVQINKTKDLRDDKGIFGYNTESFKSSEYYAGHKERINAHIIRIHTESGPIRNCNCSICKGYRTTGNCAKYHEIACGCVVCQELAYQNLLETQRQYQKT